MQIVSNGDNLHEMLNPVFWEKNKKNIINLSFAELTKRVVKVIFFCFIIIKFLYLLVVLQRFISPLLVCLCWGFTAQSTQ